MGSAAPPLPPTVPTAPLLDGAGGEGSPWVTACRYTFNKPSTDNAKINGGAACTACDNTSSAADAILPTTEINTPSRVKNQKYAVRTPARAAEITPRLPASTNPSTIIGNIHANSGGKPACNANSRSPANDNTAAPAASIITVATLIRRIRCAARGVNPAGASEDMPQVSARTRADE